MTHVLKPLPYPQNALEPWCDAETLALHHDKHQQAYLDNLNDALRDHPELAAKSLEWLLKNPDAVPALVRKKVMNNAGGVWNHDFFWSCMGPEKGGEPKGGLAKALEETFGDFAEFQARFKESALAQFGSGWAFLVRGKDGKIAIENFANQNCPVTKGRTALLTLDVWEHAYYLQYRNRRADWIDAWWNTVDWDAAAARM